MNIEQTTIKDVLLLKPQVYEDERGFFMETFRESNFAGQGMEVHFVQDNLSHSRKGTVRGLHYQKEHPQDKLVMAVAGTICDVAVDLRLNSPTFGQHISHLLSAENKYQLFIPKGFAHGFSVLSDEALVYYKCSDYYHADAERGLLWNDPRLDIDWKVSRPILSDKDQQQPLLNDIPKHDLFE